MKRISKEQETLIMNLYSQGFRSNQIAEILNINKSTLGGWFYRNHPEIKFRPSKGNVNYFDIINSYSKAYILGFIAADGSLIKESKTNRTTLSITVKYEDKDVLDFIKSEIGNKNKIIDINKKSPFDNTKYIHQARYSITSKELTSSIIKYGIGYNKSLTIGNIINNIPTKYKDAFIIGYFDGDGSVTVRDGLHKNSSGYLIKDNSLYVQIRGTREFLKGICNHLNITESHIHQYDSIPQLSFANKKDIIRFFKCYNNLSFYYKRKYNKFLQRINHKSFDKYKQVQTISSSIE